MEAASCAIGAEARGPTDTAASAIASATPALSSRLIASSAWQNSYGPTQDDAHIESDAANVPSMKLFPLARGGLHSQLTKTN